MKPYEWKYKWILLWNSSSLLVKSFRNLPVRFHWIGSKSATVHSAESGKVGKLPLEQKSSFLSLFFISFHYEIGFVIYHVLKRCAKKVFFRYRRPDEKKSNFSVTSVTLRSECSKLLRKKNSDKIYRSRNQHFAKTEIPFGLIGFREKC